MSALLAAAERMAAVTAASDRVSQPDHELQLPYRSDSWLSGAGVGAF